MSPSSSLIDVLQDGPKRCPGGSKRPLRGPQDAPKRPQRGPKRPPRRPKRPPRGPKEAPKRPPRSPRTVSFKPTTHAFISSCSSYAVYFPALPPTRPAHPFVSMFPPRQPTTHAFFFSSSSASSFSSRPLREYSHETPSIAHEALNPQHTPF